jgi:hypothetical protein
MLWRWERNSWCTRLSASKKAISIFSTFDRTCLAFFGRVDDDICCLRFVVINPWFISCDNTWQESSVTFGTLQQFEAGWSVWFVWEAREQVLPTRISFHDPASVLLGTCQMTRWGYQQSLWSQTSVRTDYCIDTVNSFVGSCRWWPACVWIIVDGLRPFLNMEYHSKILDRLNAVSPNAGCGISYVSLAVLPSFWQNLCNPAAPSTHPFHKTT